MRNTNPDEERDPTARAFSLEQLATIERFKKESDEANEDPTP